MSLINQVLRDLDKNTKVNAPLKFHLLEQAVGHPLRNTLLIILSILFAGGIYWFVSLKSPTQPPLIQTELVNNNKPKELDPSLNAELPTSTTIVAAEQLIETAVLAEDIAQLQTTVETPIAEKSITIDKKPTVLESEVKVAVTDAAENSAISVQVIKSNASPVNKSEINLADNNHNNQVTHKVKNTANQATVKTQSSESQLINQLNDIKRQYANANNPQQGIMSSISQLHQLLDAHAEFHAARLYLIQLCWQANACATADILTEAVRLFPHQTEFRLLAARFFVEANEFETALGFLKNLNANIAQYQQFLQLRGLVLQNLQQHQSALLDYAEILKHSPDRGDIFLAMGISFEALGDQPQAKQSFQRALSDQRLSARQQQFASTKISQNQG